MIKLPLAILCVSLTAAAPVLCAQPPAAPAEIRPPAAETRPLAAKDEAFLKNAARGGMAEVRLGELAAQKAANAEVKEFGSMMVTDHTAANDELKALAASKNLKLPDSLDAKHQALHNRLSKLSGAEFDRAYMSEMLRDHKADVAEFESASRTAKDPEVKAFAAKTLPTLQRHLERAQSLETTLGGAKNAAKGKS